jgi:hypothetical protein
VVFCPDCDEPLDDVPQGAACPGCGGYRRSVSVTAEVAAVAVMTAAATVSTKRVGFPPWTEKWHTSLYWLGQLREAYSPGAQLGNVEVQRRAETFFDECNHLRYWLQGDVAALPGVRLGDINQHFKNSPELKWCRDIGDTYKHHTRDHGPTARIEETIVSATGSQVNIRVDVTNPSAGTVDALDLAERCIGSWRAFFKAFGIAPPP